MDSGMLLNSVVRRVVGLPLAGAPIQGPFAPEVSQGSHEDADEDQAVQVSCPTRLANAKGPGEEEAPSRSKMTKNTATR